MGLRRHGCWDSFFHCTMKLIIHKGNHWPSFWWLRWPFYFNRKVIERDFLLGFSCMYAFEGLAQTDQADNNKLFGISYYPNDHIESARIGWRYDPSKRMFVVSAYCYVQKQRIMTDLCQLAANRKYIGRIRIEKDYYAFSVYEKENMRQLANYSVPKWHKRKFGYKLGLYFGGNQVAPHKMTVEIKNI